MNKRMYQAPRMAVVKLNVQRLLESGSVTGISGNANFKSSVKGGSSVARSRQANVWADDEDDWEE